MERPIQPGVRTTTGTDDLTATPTPARRQTRNDMAARPDEQSRPYPRGPSPAIADAQTQLIGGSRLRALAGSAGWRR
jgi:hypothetical protein